MDGKLKITLLCKHHVILQKVQSYLNSKTFEKNFSFFEVEVETTQKGTNVLSITWNEKVTEKYPAVWLRDNCQCSKCYQASAFARLHVMQKVDTEIKIQSTFLSNDGKVSINFKQSF